MPNWLNKVRIYIIEYIKPIFIIFCVIKKSYERIFEGTVKFPLSYIKNDEILEKYKWKLPKNYSFYYLEGTLCNEVVNDGVHVDFSFEVHAFKGHRLLVDKKGLDKFEKYNFKKMYMVTL